MFALLKRFSIQGYTAFFHVCMFVCALLHNDVIPDHSEYLQSIIYKFVYIALIIKVSSNTNTEKAKSTSKNYFSSLNLKK